MEQTFQHPSQASPPLKVLVVDDNIINQKVAAKMLERLACSVDVVSDGQQAVDAVKRQPYDLVLMDVQMPVMDGLDATKNIRTMEGELRHTIIIAVTANAIQGDRERCLASGMDDYLPKPIKQQDIQSMISKWITAASPDLSGHPANRGTEAIVIDPVRIDQIMEIGDESLLVELFTLYLDDLTQFEQSVASAFREKDFRTIYENSHKLKGSSANIGVEPVRQACIAMEEFAKQQNAAQIEEHLEQMRLLIGRVILHIRSTYVLP